MDPSSMPSMDPFQSWWPFIFAIIIGIAIGIRAFMGGQTCPSTNQINSQIVIVTGSSGGIGKEICRILCDRGAHLIMACKDIEKATAAKDEIIKMNKLAKIEIRPLDLNSFDCIRRFVKQFANDYKKLDVLINNAGMIFNVQEKTVDGFETHLQVNYLAQFLLTALLMPELKAAEQGRVINVSAHAYCSGKMNDEDPLNIGTWAPAFHQRDAFAHSKLAVVLSSRHLAKLLKDTSVTVNVCTPGLVRGTDHLRRSPIMRSFCAKLITYPWMWLFMKNSQQGAQTAIYLATEKNLRTVTGMYFNDCEQTDVIGLATDDELAASLFKHTIKALKLNETII